MNIKTTILVFLFFGIPRLAFCQYVVSGKIESPDKESVPFATIVLYEDDSIKAATISDTTGGFILKKINRGKYSLNISHIGYKDYDTNIVCNSDVNFNAISLKTKENYLDHISVYGSVNAKVYVDRLVYPISQMDKKNSADAFQVLKNIPELNVNALDKTLSIEGAENILILVNNIKRDFQFMQNINPKIIESVEIITNPSTKYLSHDISGIINIITADRVVGYFGKIGTSTTVDLRTNSWDDVSFSLDKKKISFYVSGMFSYLNEYKHKSQEEINTINEFYTTKIEKETNAYSFNKNSYKINGGIEFNANKDNLILLDFMIREWEGISKKNYKGKVYQNNIFSNDFVDSLISDNSELYERYSIYYQNSQKGLFAIEMNYNQIRDLSDSYFSSSSPKDIFLNHFNYLSNKSSIDIQADYSIGFDKFNIGVGTRGYFQKVSQNTDYLLPSGLTEIFQFKEQRYYPYFNLNGKLKSNVTYNIGFGFEVNQFNIQNKQNTYKKFKTLPKAGVQYKINETNSIKLNYLTRLYRPSPVQLNPIKRQTDSTAILNGNPDLKPFYSHRLRLIYTLNRKNIYISPTIDYNFQPNFISQVGYTNSYGVYEKTYQNISFYNKLEASISLKYSIIKNLQFKSNLSYYNMNFIDPKRVNFQLQSFGIRATATYNVERFMFYLSYYYKPKILHAERVINGANDSWFSASYNINDEWFLGFSLRYFDIWNETVKIVKNDYYYELLHSCDDRFLRLFINVSYTFKNEFAKKKKSKRISNMDSGIEMDL